MIRPRPYRVGSSASASAVDQLLAAAAVADQHLDRDDRQVELAGDRVQAVAAGDVDAVEDLAEDARGGQAGEPGEVDGRLGVPRAAEDAPVLGDEREQVAGADQVGGPRGGVDDRADGRRALLGADAGPARLVVDRDGERGAVRARCSARPSGGVRAARPARAVIGMQSWPRPCVIMNSTISGVTRSAAAMKSPSFSRSSSSTTITTRPAAIASRASSIFENW